MPRRRRDHPAPTRRLTQAGGRGYHHAAMGKGARSSGGGGAARVLLVDGYNVIHRVPELRPSLDGGLQNARNRLALQVARWARAHPGVECLIVFDGDIDRSGGRGEERIAGVRCAYSLTAHGGDDELIRIVRDHKGRTSDITVVSDDNKVGNSCRAHGAVVRPAGFIMDAGGKAAAGGPSGPNARRGKGSGKGLDRKSEAEIDAELRKRFGVD